MNISPNDVIRIAQAEIGYREKTSNAALDDQTANAGSGNYTKYARDLAAAGYYNGNKNGYAWCDVFVDWCFYQAANRNAAEAQRIECQSGDLGAGCVYSAQYYKNAGRWSTTPQVGAQIFFRVNGDINHTGIVELVQGDLVYTIEGNSGDCVRRHIYNEGEYKIAGYGLPLYTDNVQHSKFNGVSYGSKGAAVVCVQYILEMLGYKLPIYGCDGEYGDETRSALLKFCADKKIAFSSTVNDEIWGALGKAVFDAT